MHYKSDGVSIDQNFARFGQKSYAINKINSTEVRKKVIPGSIAYIAWFAIVCLIGVALIDSLVKGGDPEVLVFLLVIIGVLALLGFHSYGRRHDTHRYQLFLTTSSSEIEAFETGDQQEIERLRGAIESAITAQPS